MGKQKNKMTCITVFDPNSIKKINSYIKNVNIKLCKLKYDEIDREEKDSLPFHTTICVWINKDKNKIEKYLEDYALNEFEIKIVGTKIKPSTQNSFNLYFELEINDTFKDIQEYCYKNEYTRVEKYNPKTFIPHITIHIDKDYEKILDIQNSIMSKFEPFSIKIVKLSLYEIYPPNKIF